MHLHYKHIGHSCKMLNIIALQTYIVAYIYIYLYGHVKQRLIAL